MSDKGVWRKTSDSRPTTGEVVNVRMVCSLSESGFNPLGRCVWRNGIWVHEETAYWWFDDYTEWAVVVVGGGDR